MAGQGRAGVSPAAVERWWEAGLVGGGWGEGRPDWAAFAEEAWAVALEQAVAPEGDHPGLSGFEWVLRPFTVRAGERLERSVSGRARRLVDMPAVRDDLERHLSGRLARAAARTLVLELYEARSAGLLAGDDTRARFRDFLGRIASRRGLAALLAGRPVLARILGRAALDAADAVAEALERLADDHAALTAGLLEDSGGSVLVGVEPGAGDGHRGGRSVMLLRFADGARLVYKPRPLSAHRHFNDLVAWFNGLLPDSEDLRTLRLLDRGDYGWVEFVAAGPCASAAEVETFYRRQGALLALLHLIDGTDLHHENLIAAGAHPVLVDVETLFHPPLAGTSTQDPAARALHDSVYRVGLLPQLFVGDHSALDVSAVGGGREAVSPVPRADWADAGTDRMRLVRRAGRFGESANRPRLADGGPIEPAAHIEALCAGFRAGYTAIGAVSGELLHRSALLKAFAEDEVRVLVRPTWVYSTLLDESTHPDLLKDADERQRVLETLRTDELGTVLASDVVDEEIAQLWAGDVPLFTARPAQGRLWGVPERPLAGRTDLSGIARVAARLAALDTVDRQDQEWIVRAAMATASRAPAHRPARDRRTRTAERAPEPERLLSAARSVGDRLVSLAYREGPRSNWIGLELLDDRYWRIGPMPADLAGGYTGPALFLAQLAALTGAGHYAEVARTALAPVPGLLEALRARPGDLCAVGSGAFSGLGGIAYALAETARLLDDPEVGSWAFAMLRLAGAAALSEREHGVGAGVAGGLVALLAAHRAGAGAGAADEGQETWRDAQACADRLTAVDPTAGGRGFTAGAAGIGWALLRFADAAGSGGGAAEGSERYRRAGLSALRAAVGGEPTDEARASAWCRGSAGIALAVLDAPGALDDPHLAAWTRRTVEELGRAGPAADDSLCHGEAGLCELLGRSAVPEVRPHWIRRAGALLASVEETGARSGAPDGVPHPGLLTGLAGIGHGLLRAGFPERVPSLLLLDTP
ncbi:type 2 lanthipeptide synthetase LanM family protein [Streptomyces sp. NBC_01565]|uniref:type 2 lanthipeptide synthetase LanM family protein n=1 Tax=unclassified Streptomyces TaxID=2593676 RepID=UPI002256EB59|nr:type 2 lanthipeptide synthetase LanM family protein [Streptomyces sp. NBC_01565]MCX4546052.1 type 2 lanthipeptide synthetase LanM family protein [Streptomyces sp. NBC_01565]